MTIKRISRSLMYEDFEVGKVFEHHWGRTFVEADAVWFSNMTMQYNPLYFNRLHSRSLGYDDIPVHPLFVFSTTLGLSVEDLSEAGGPFLGIDDLEFLEVVYPGSTVRARSAVLQRRLTKSRPGWGIVEWRTEAIDEHDCVVLRFRRRNLSRLRAPMDFPDERSEGSTC